MYRVLKDKQMQVQKYAAPVPTYYATLNFHLLNKKLTHWLLLPWESFTLILAFPYLSVFWVEFHVGQTDIQTGKLATSVMQPRRTTTHCLLCSYLSSVAGPTTHQRDQWLQPFVDGIQSRIQWLERQLLARQRHASSADNEQWQLQAQVWPTGDQRQLVLRRVQ